MKYLRQSLQMQICYLHSVFLAPASLLALPVLEMTLLSKSNPPAKLDNEHLQDIKDHFSQYGPVAAVNFHLDMDGAHIIFENAESLKAAATAAKTSESGKPGGKRLKMRAFFKGTLFEFSAAPVVD